MKFIIKILAIVLFCTSTAHASDLSIMLEGTPRAYLSLNNQPVMAVSCSAPFLFYADSTTFNIKQWAAYQKSIGVTHVTASIPLNWHNIEAFVVENGGKAENCIFPFNETAKNSRKFDLSRFNPRWWNRFRTYCKYLSDNGFIIQLTLWDGRQLSLPQSDSPLEYNWDGNFFNPNNNTDTVTKYLNNERCTEIYHSYFDDKLELASLQERLFRKVIETTYDIGTVYYNLAYQVSENQGNWQKTNSWIDEMIESIRKAWRGYNASRQLIIGIDAGGFSEYQQDWIFDNAKFNILINSDIDEYEQISRWRKLYKKAYCATQLSSLLSPKHLWNNDDNTHISSLLWYNSFLLNQIVNINTGALDYKELNASLPDKSISQLIETIQYWQKFWLSVEVYWELENQGKVNSKQYKTKFIQSSNNEAVIFLTSDIKKAEKIFNEEQIGIENCLLTDGFYTVMYFDTSSKTTSQQEIKSIQGSFQLDIPECTGGLGILIKRKQKQ